MHLLPLVCILSLCNMVCMCLDLQQLLYLFVIPSSFNIICNKIEHLNVSASAISSYERCLGLTTHTQFTKYVYKYGTFSKSSVVKSIDFSRHEHTLSTWELQLGDNSI